MNKRLAFVIIIAAIFSHKALAEYRAFQLQITEVATGQSRIVLTRLDPDQYPTYYHVKPTEKITITSTWFCAGRTNHLSSTCPNPNPPRTDSVRPESDSKAASPPP